MQGHYQRLAAYLTTLPAATYCVTLTFGQLCQILGQPLPASAWGRSWWTSRARATAPRAWPAEGWRVGTASVSGGREAVTFVRTAAIL